MTRKSKRPADIRTDRTKPELPILDRLLPTEPIITERPATAQTIDQPVDADIPVDAGVPAAAGVWAETEIKSETDLQVGTDIRVGTGAEPASILCPASGLSRAPESAVEITAPADERSGGHQERKSITGRRDDVAFDWPGDAPGAVSINLECLEYDGPLQTRSWSRRFLAGLLPALLLAGLATVTALVFTTVVFTSEAAGAIGRSSTGLQSGPLQGPEGGGEGQMSEEPIYASIGLEAKVQPALAVDGAGCLNSPAAPVAVGQAVTYCYLVTNLGTTNLTDIRVTDESLGLDGAELPLASGQPTLQPGEQAVLYHHAVAGERAAETESIVTAQPVDQNGAPVVDLVAPSGVGSPDGITDPSNPVSEDNSSTSSAEVDTTAPDVEGDSTALSPAEPVTPTAETSGDNSGQPPASQPPTADVAGADPAAAEPSAAADVTAAEPSAAADVTAAEPQVTEFAGPADRASAGNDAAVPTQLALTGIRTEPWIMVFVAMGLIFIGYTAVAAYKTARSDDKDRGHEQLDSLGFE